ncbi:S8 family serine peptidase, partial [Candidatus Woesearchaeota archaeon]|nr:S8 family serine peptidase [Candidatus Woesearchaeota archaeon]
MDDQGHGTHVAGIVASTNDPYTGIAPEANIVALKVLDFSGFGTTENVIAGIDWCVNNAATLNISVISMSLGGGQYNSSCDSEDSSTAASINTAVSQNITVVVATGNTNANYPTATAGIATPACIQNSIRVTAVDKSDSMASFAFRHSSFPDI